jgi:hypothetical protein
MSLRTAGARHQPLVAVSLSGPGAATSGLTGPMKTAVSGA